MNTSVNDGWSLGAGAAQGSLRASLGGMALPHLLVLAAALRLLIMPIATPVHPDEVFQYLEPAHRLLFGHGLITWEWRAGIRGWLIPLLVSAPMGLGARIAPDSDLYLLLPNLVMVAASLVTVVVAWRLGERISRLHAQFAGLAAAIWYEFIYFAPHVMSETLAIAVLLPAAMILLDRERWSFRRLAIAAALLANAAAFRFQFLPAIATLVTACCWRNVRHCWRPLLIGGLIGLVPCAVVDIAMGSFPFAWIAENIRLNFIENRAANYNTSGPFGYFVEIWLQTALWSVPLLVLAFVGARRYPALAWTAIANFLFHSAIGHKEYRFVLLSMTLAVLLAAIGTIDWVLAVQRRDGPDAGKRRLRFLVIAWTAATLSCGLGGFRFQWMKYRPSMDLYDHLRNDRSLCGLAVYRYVFTTTGGYTYLHRPVPMYYFTSEDTARPNVDLRQNAGAYNAIMAAPFHAGEIPADFKPVDCEGQGMPPRGDARVCVYRRPGPCTVTNNRFEANSVLRRLDQ